MVRKQDGIIPSLLRLYAGSTSDYDCRIKTGRNGNDDYSYYELYEIDCLHLYRFMCILDLEYFVREC